MQAAACPITTAEGKPGLPDTRLLQSQPNCLLLRRQTAHSVVRKGSTRSTVPAALAKHGYNADLLVGYRVSAGTEALWSGSLGVCTSC